MLKKIEPIDFVDLEDWESEDECNENDDEVDCQTPTPSNENFIIEDDIEKKLNILRPKRKSEESLQDENGRPNSLSIENKNVELTSEDHEKNNNDSEFITPKNTRTKLIVSEDLLKPLTPLSPNGGGTNFPSFLHDFF